MTYNSKSCSSLEKAYYTPIEAALRWCNLIAHEVLILERVGDGVLPSVGMFPQWPCLRVNAEKILDAIHNCEIPYGRDGKTVQPGEQVAKHRLTVRHSDLKSWMSKNYPNQKPAFLFDAVEQQLHAGITVEAYQTLQAENKLLLREVPDLFRTSGRTQWISHQNTRAFSLSKRTLRNNIFKHYWRVAFSNVRAFTCWY